MLYGSLQCRCNDLAAGETQLIILCRGMRPKGACCDIGFMSVGGVAKVSKVWSIH